jgi:hypothetical protein
MGADLSYLREKCDTWVKAHSDEKSSDFQFTHQITNFVNKYYMLKLKEDELTERSNSVDSFLGETKELFEKEFSEWYIKCTEKLTTSSEKTVFDIDQTVTWLATCFKGSLEKKEVMKINLNHVAKTYLAKIEEYAEFVKEPEDWDDDLQNPEFLNFVKKSSEQMTSHGEIDHHWMINFEKLISDMIESEKDQIGVLSEPILNMIEEYQDIYDEDDNLIANVSKPEEILVEKLYKMFELITRWRSNDLAFLNRQLKLWEQMKDEKMKKNKEEFYDFFPDFSKVFLDMLCLELDVEYNKQKIVEEENRKVMILASEKLTNIIGILQPMVLAANTTA